MDKRTLASLTVATLTAALLSAPAGAQEQSITLDRPIYTVAEGGTVRVGVTANAGTTVDFAIAGLSPSSGTLTFTSGGTQWISLAAPTDREAEPAALSTLRVGGATATVVVNANGFAYLDGRQPVHKRVADLLKRMTLEEKVGQMAQAERSAVFDNPALIAQWKLGSILSGGGSTPPANTPAAWLDMVNAFQAQALTTRLQIPVIYGVDAVHGHGNVYGATIFPHNIGLGATRDPRLLEEIGRATAVEVRATGIPWNFSPCLCVARDERWGRTYESFSEDPALVAQLSTIIDGMQDAGVLATAKHYAGDGNTEFDPAIAEANRGKPWWEQRYTIDQGVTVTSRPAFAWYDFSPYLPALKREKVGSVMPSFSSIDWTEDGVGNPTKMHAHRDLITGLLKERAGFDGIVISDWEGIHQIPDPAEPTNGGLTAYKVRTAVNAGIDMAMQPNNAKQFIDLLLAEVGAGRVSMVRIDDAVSRILRKKFELGLFDNPFTSPANLGKVGSPEHRALARKAVAASQALLKNENALPLRPQGNIYVAGRNADNIGNQAGGWTIQWQGVSGDSLPGTSILEGIREVAPQATVTFSEDASAPTTGADVGIVVVGETPYAEGYGDVDGPECGFCAAPQHEEKSLTLQPGDRAVIDKVCSAISTCVVLVVSGRPQVLTDQLGQMDALVASWLPGSEGAGVADVLFGRRPFTGRLPMTWPRTVQQVPINVGDRDYDPLFPYGWGLRHG
ncbi:glycoside hydrolase family 3 protein [Allorhizocola rhizosphaerae]|uniref:glycoside hydrolase family 3 protein n=1 Tax=Allorhizocola rhizosphaerae TaxID=1872709 RepID=UPI000E3E99ED|nr:glycoside hydrolase family 3 protein [Allorhizocola rhizosphaerae]